MKDDKEPKIPECPYPAITRHFGDFNILHDDICLKCKSAHKDINELCKELALLWKLEGRSNLWMVRVKE